MLEQLENFNNREKVDIENLVNSNILTIEHIMPQNLNFMWKKDLGFNYKQIHEQYLHTIGNITLTGYNSKMSNKLFSEKRDMENGFKDSRLFLNQSLKDLDSWNEKTILNRANLLANRALKIWKFPKTFYQPQNKYNEKIFTLSDDDINFTGKKPLSFKFKNRKKEQQVKNWKEFFIQIMEILYDFDPVTLKKIIAKRNYECKGNFSSSTRQHQIGNLCFKIPTATEAMLANLRFIVYDINLDLDDIIFTIK